MHPTLPIALLLVALTLAATPILAAPPVPLSLPRPDGQPGNTKKPVKVYILAGQSNMVGMGDLTGARPPFTRVFYSADPTIIPGAAPIGENSQGKPLDRVAVERHGVYDAKATVLDGGKVVKPPMPTALGTAGEDLPPVQDAQTLVVEAEFDVPATGEYLIHAGFGESTHNTIVLDGKSVTGKVALEAGKRYPVKITYSMSGSCAFWLERVDIPGQGDLVTLTKVDKKFPYLIDAAGQWTARNDVTYTDPRLFPMRPASPLSATSNNGKSIGPELGFGSVVGTFHDEQVLLIKTAMGNRSLQFDFQPPSSGRTDPDSKFEGYEYRAMIEGVRDTLAKIDRVVPGYQGQGYEIAGFGWFQGHKDSGSPKEEYEKHLVNLIQDLRKEFKAPKMPVVVATVGFQGYRLSSTPWWGIWEAQMAVGDPKQHPEFADTVASVDTRDFWREVEESPRSQDYHYHRNPGTYLLVGEAMGRAMVRLLGEQAEPIPKSDRESKVAAALAAEAAAPAKTPPTKEQKAAHAAASKPLILDGALATFLANPKFQLALQAALKSDKPAKPTPFLEDSLDDVVGFYKAAGIDDYDWQPFGGDMKNASWDYFGFDLPGHPNRAKSPSTAGAPEEPEGGDDRQAEPAAKGKPKSPPSLQITLPAGLENWFTSGFDPRKAGWKTGPAPFGESSEKVVLPEWAADRTSARVSKTLCDNDVLLLRQSFEVPPLKDGHRYRIRVGGSAHNNMGESYTIHANGKLLFENREGVTAWRRQGSSPRGVMISPESRDLFQGGKLLLAVSNFAMENFSANQFIPPGPALSIWLEEQKLPPVGK